MERLRRVSVYIVGLLLSVLLAAPTQAGSLLGEEWEKFLTERVRFGGFVENTTGLSVSQGDRHFNTSNRFIMNRFTVQPEFNVDFHEKVNLFISWRFVKEPRYNSEAKSRRTCCPTRLRSLDNDFYDEDSPKPWEMVWNVNPTDRFNIRLGRQFISWGETDGLRLLDVINPQDATFAPPAAPNLFNLDETRIPSWGIRTLYTVRPVSNTIFEFFALPGFDEAKQRVDEVLGSNDTADGIVRYGRWSSHPETRMPAAFGGIGRLFANPIGPAPVVIPSVDRQLPDAGDSWKIGSRITHNIGKLNFGLGYIWGFNPQSTDMVFKLKGTVPGPGGTTIAQIRLINDRTSIFAGHFNYTVDEILSVPLNTAIRGEMAFYPSEPYNISKFPGPTVAPGITLKAGPHPRHPDGITEKNTLRYALGFDRTVLIPFLQEDPLRAFRMSFQIFQRIILDHENGIRFFSTAEKIKNVSTNLTFRVSTGYLGDTILPDVFVGYDPAGYWNLNPAVTYAPPWNEKITIGLIGALYGGHNKFNSLGLFSEKDSVFLKMRYQF
jgi:hypothetical protein